MKKIILGIVVVILAFSLVACGEKNNDTNLESVTSGEQIKTESGNQNVENGEKSEDANNVSGEAPAYDLVSIITANNWFCYKMTDGQNNEIPMTVAFGSSYNTYPGSLTFFADGTFKHFKPGISDGTEPTDGTYTLDGIDIYLTYSDGITSQDGSVFVGENDAEIFLLAYSDEEIYKMYFKPVETDAE